MDDHPLSLQYEQFQGDKKKSAFQNPMKCLAQAHCVKSKLKKKTNDRRGRDRMLTSFAIIAYHCCEFEY